MNDSLLKVSLAAAVPLWIIRYERQGLPDNAQIQADAREVAEHGDRILFKSSKGTAEAFNALARGIAVCAFAPGGVTIFGMHFEAATMTLGDP